MDPDPLCPESSDLMTPTGYAVALKAFFDRLGVDGCGY